jgi:dTDP-4-dehydrorhamnose reductase
MAEIVVLGYKGMLGRYVYSYLQELHEGVRGIGSQDGPLSEQDLNGTVIINCAGAIPQRYTDEDRNTYYQLNIALPRLLETYAERLIHVSTDCVFSGKKGCYTEDDAPDPNSLYGASKYLGEPLGYNSFTIRTSIIGDSAPHGLLGWYVNNEWKQVDGYTNHLWNGVTCLQLAKEIDRLLREGGPPLYHYHSPAVISKYQLLTYINHIYGGPDILPVEAETAVDRTLMSKYNFMAPSILVQLEEMFNYEAVS